MGRKNRGRVGSLHIGVAAFNIGGTVVIVCLLGIIEKLGTLGVRTRWRRQEDNLAWRSDTNTYSSTTALGMSSKTVGKTTWDERIGHNEAK